jgi:hypothetical protein
MKHNIEQFSGDLPRRLSRKQAHKWASTRSTPRFLRHIGGTAARVREANLSGREVR